MKRNLLLGLAFVILSGPAAHGGELTVLSAGAVEAGLVGLLESFRRETGQQVAVAFATAPAIRRKMAAGDSVDVLIAPLAVLDELTRDRKLAAEGRAVLGRVGVGVTVRAGAPKPDISTPEALTQAVLRADSLVYNEASTGIYFARLLERLGIADRVKAKTTRYPDGAAVMEHVARGRGDEIGVGPITEILAHVPKGLLLVGPLPAAVQNYTSYAAAVMAGSPSPEEGRRLIRHLTSPAAKAAFAATGVDEPR